MKYVAIMGVLLTYCLSGAAIGSVCQPQGNIISIVPSAGVTGFSLDVPLTGCSCDHNVIWIDTATDGGKSMYSAALAAKMAKQPVLATIEDGKGQGSPGNTSVSHRYWATCQLQALEVL